MDSYIFEDCLQNYLSNKKEFWPELEKKYNIDREKLRSQFKRERVRRGIPSKEKQRTDNYEYKHDPVSNSHEEIAYKETIEQKENGICISDKLIRICEEELKNPKSVLKAHGFDPDLWDIIAYKHNMWHGPTPGGNKQILYQSKISVKPKRSPEWNEETINAIFKRLEIKHFESPNFVSPNIESNEILIFPISDLHLGLLATEKVCGNEYNLEIAEELFYRTIEQTISRISNRKIEEIVFVLGNDFLNSDNLSNTTSHLTPQDSVDFWYKLVDKAVELIINGTNTLRKIAPVTIYYVPSNHDEHSFYGIMKIVETYYRNTDDVWVDTSPFPRKYYYYGKNIVGFTHNIDIKKSLGIVSYEAKNYWSNAENAYLMLGHLHQAMQFEKQGMLEIYRLPTISGTSRWSTGLGFFQAHKVNQSFILNKDYGITDVMNVVME